MGAFLGRLPCGRFLSLLQISCAHIYLTYPFVLSWSLMEAMSAGAAIVASDTTPVREVMRNGEMGVLVDFFDQDALLSQLVRLLKDPRMRVRLGGAARQHIRQHYDLKPCACHNDCAGSTRWATLGLKPTLLNRPLQM